MQIENNPLRHIIEAQQFTRGWLEDTFFPETKKMEKTLKAKGYEGSLIGKSACLLFYEPSTRTRMSFEQAATKLGMTISTTENARTFSSAVKGESLVDTIRVANALRFDAIVLRYYEEGGAKAAAEVSKVPVINAGDGRGQHPTQALLDIYTAKRHFGTLDDLHVAFVGDLQNGRTARSAAYLLSKYRNVHFDFVAPDTFQMRPDLLEYMDEHHIFYSQSKRLIDVCSQADLIYLTRIQKERIGKHDSGSETLFTGSEDVKLNDEVLSRVRPGSIIMHPLPREEAFGELPEKYTNDKRVIIFQQVENGLYTRMALLKMLLKI